jgi:FtsZ-binding cell division protein ZapB
MDIKLQKVVSVQKEIQTEIKSLKEKHGKLDRDVISKYEKMESVVRGFEFEL